MDKLYRALFVSAYFGLLRVGELTAGPHVIMVRNVHLGDNKDKFLFILESSKTHGKDKNPQLVKISSRKMKHSYGHHSRHNVHTEKDHVCAFSIIREYIKVRPKAKGRNSNEQFFVFADKSPVLPSHMRSTLRKLLSKFGLKPELYNTHSFRIERCCDLLKMGFEIPTIQKIGRWHSNAIYTYLR